MIRQFVVLAALLPFGGSAALACTAEDGRIAAEWREDRRDELRKVRGTYRVFSASRRSEKQFGQIVDVATYYGRITTKGGRTFDTLHEDDGSIILCGTFDTPVADAQGIFYLKRGRAENEASYQLVDWEGSYLRPPSTSQAVREISE